ncbi:hypothetical protein Dda_2745 [Drechslerella dactyloides]|uniref:HNH nuclease domain-containing protein n=1 Tax=Drechslerella dactyloides TaxID=74499 RepID=A0AAD6J4F5_DREDA|nr:hypothetical protein Dda_2745 [Drechslerella dactyloides]
MQSPFKPAKIQRRSWHHKSEEHLDEISGVSHADIGILQAILSTTPNPKLLRDVVTYDADTITELARVSAVGLKALRSWGGRPGSLAASPATRSPAGSVTASPISAAQSSIAAQASTIPRVQQLQAGRLTALLATSTNLPVLDPTLGEASHSHLGWKSTSQGLYRLANRACIGHEVIKRLEIKKEFPDLADTREARTSLYKEFTERRQQGFCPFTGFDLNEVPKEIAHLFPFSLLDLESGKNRVAWRFIAIFLGEELRDRLVEAIKSEDHGIQSPANSIALDIGLHGRLDKGSFSLVPVRQSQPPGSFIDVRLDWHLPPRSAVFSSFVPEKPEDQYSYNEDEHLTRIFLNSPSQRARTGSVYRLGTNDPRLLPIPSPILFHWHTFIWKVLGRAGFAVTVASKSDTVGSRSPKYSPKQKKRKEPESGDGGDDDAERAEDYEGNQDGESAQTGKGKKKAKSKYIASGYDGTRDSGDEIPQASRGEGTPLAFHDWSLEEYNAVDIELNTMSFVPLEDLENLNSDEE